MRLPEFIRLYVPELQDKKVEEAADLPAFLPFDEIVEDIDGRKIKVVFAGAEEIPVEAIIDMTLEDFRQEYPSDAAFDAYEKYHAYVEVEEAWEAAQKFHKSKRDAIEEDKLLWKDFLL